MTEVVVKIEAEGMRIGPDEVLVVRVPETTPGEVIEGLADALVQVGLRGRSLVIAMDVQLVAAPREEQP